MLQKQSNEAAAANEELSCGMQDVIKRLEELKVQDADLVNGYVLPDKSFDDTLESAR